ncbi:ribonuclease III domain-containing protein [Roseburia hominis]
MEKSIGFDIPYMREFLDMEEVDIQNYSPLAFAYIGDSVFDLLIRTLVVSRGNKQVKKLHQETSSIVQASSQSEMMRVLQPLLTEEEHAVYKRGRNAKSVSPAKHQTLTDYRRATGFEALIGWLYLKNDWERILELVAIGLKHLEEKEEA